MQRYTRPPSLHLQGDVWICMELLDSSMDKISERVYNQLHSAIPEKILGKMSVAVRYTWSRSELCVYITPRDVLVLHTISLLRYPSQVYWFISAMHNAFYFLGDKSS